MQKGINQQNLQELIDSYNAEMMRYSQKAQPAMPQQNSPANQRTAGEQALESGEEAIERGITERNYWLAQGKQGLQHGAPTFPRPEPNEPLYRPNSHMPRPEPDEPLERPVPHQSHIMTQPAVTASATPAEPTEQEAWLEELRLGLQELHRGLEELAQGQRELLAGQEAYRQGISERDRWLDVQQATAPASSSPSAQPYSPPISTTDNTSNPHAAPYSTPAPVQPIQPISSNGRSAQSQESIPSDGVGTGYLQVGVYTARQAMPIPNARVTVFRETSGGNEIYASETTDDDGKIPLLQLPTGTSSVSAVSAPFVNYNVSVAADGYYPRSELQAQIFSGITAILWVELTPLPDSAWPPTSDSE